MRLLITQASNALAYRIKKHFRPEFTLLVDVAPLPALSASDFTMIGEAYRTDTLLHELLSLCLRENINAICAIVPEEQEALIKNQTLFAEYAIQIVKNPFLKG